VCLSLIVFQIILYCLTYRASDESTPSPTFAQTTMKTKSPKSSSLKVKGKKSKGSKKERRSKKGDDAEDDDDDEPIIQAAFGVVSLRND